ncbi:MAG: hypothetical protein KGI59_01360 [Patescibacteria group bacterium]|nr:hypothetical protein [Patescibacteria group bacterium]MDE2172833.1 hypothetical protein [Patescibacteria group bacterium]
MSTRQISLIIVLIIFVIPIITDVIMSCFKRRIYKAHMRHYVDLIMADSGNERAAEYRQEILRISGRHSLPLSKIGWNEDALRKATIRSLRASAARLKVFAKRENRPDITQRHDIIVRALRDKIKQLRALAA